MQKPDSKPAKLVPDFVEGVQPLTRVGTILLAGPTLASGFERTIQRGVQSILDLNVAGDRLPVDLEARASELKLEYRSIPFGKATPINDASLDRIRKALQGHRSQSATKPNRMLLMQAASAQHVASAWLASRVLDEGVTWEVASREARQIGAGPSLVHEEYIRQYTLGAGNRELGVWKEKIRKKFPSVKKLSASELALRLNDSAKRAPVLLDVREPNEFAISHIAGAQRASKAKAALALLEGRPKDTEIVVYCSIGYRSAEMAKELSKRGYTRVRNLEGSIFEWANTGRPVVRAGYPVNQVHPFDEKWGQLLNRDLWPQPAKQGAGQ